jgi:pimeloyl-ACP methyl ester carboxylesterase
MRYVQVGDATLHVEAEGPSDLPKVVFVNSLGSDLRIWDDVVVALARANIGALRYDLRGHGLSDLGSPPALIDDHVSDLAAVMDQMGWRAQQFAGFRSAARSRLDSRIAIPTRSCA